MPSEAQTYLRPIDRAAETARAVAHKLLLWNVMAGQQAPRMGSAPVSAGVMTPVPPGFGRFLRVLSKRPESRKPLKNQGFLRFLGFPGYYWPKVEHYEDKELSD